MEYITCTAAAEQWGVGARIVRRWCQQGRIPGARREGKSYQLPVDSVPPEGPTLWQAQDAAACPVCHGL